MTGYQHPRSEGGAGLDRKPGALALGQAVKIPAIGAALPAVHNTGSSSDLAGGADNLAKRIKQAQARGTKVRQIILYGVTNANTR